MPVICKGFTTGFATLLHKKKVFNKCEYQLFVRDSQLENTPMKLMDLINEGVQENEVLDFLKDMLRGTPYENKVFLAGGAVRDEILGDNIKDLDFVVVGDLNAGISFSEFLAKKLGVYKEKSNPVIFPKFGTSKISLVGNNANLPELELEFVAPRKEKYSNNSRKPEVIGGELMDDVLRRDLTINSLLKNVSTGEVLDMTGKGLNDLKRGIIRTPDDPDIIYQDDPLRMLRAIRFSNKYNFEFAPEVLRSIKKNAHLIKNISQERVRDELNKILVTDDPKRGIRLLKVTGLLELVIGEFKDAIGMKQNKYHKEDVFKHSLSVLANTPKDLQTRLTALFHDIGKVLTKTISPDGSIHFYEHEKVGEEMVREIMQRLRYDNKFIDAVATGVKHHMYLKHGGDDAKNLKDKTLRKFRNAVGDNLEKILDVIHADNIAHSEHGAMPNQIKIVRDRLSTLDKNIDKKAQKLPIDGNDLIKLGIKPGVIFRTILNSVQEAWYENPSLSREDAMKIVSTIYHK